jgi:hypothetical protein
MRATVAGAPARERCVPAPRWGFRLDAAERKIGARRCLTAVSLRLNGESHEHKIAAVIQPRLRP